MAAVNLLFEVDEVGLQVDFACRPERTDCATLEEQFFVWPIRVRCDEVDLFDWSFNPATPWWSLPALGFSARCLHAYRAAIEFGEYWMPLPGSGSLRWTSACGVLTIECSLSAQLVRTRPAELVSALQLFRRSVARELIKRYPPIASHEVWSRRDTIRLT